MNILSIPSTGTVSKPLWVVEGDSWSASIAQGNDRNTWPHYLNLLVSDRASVISVATAGQTAATMDGTFAAQVTPLLSSTATALIFAGINDGATRTTTQLRDNLRSMWTAARAAGARVVAFTLPHRTAVGGWSQADWKIVNDQIIADSSYYDFLVRADIIFCNSLSTDFTDQVTVDNLHINTAAHKKLAAQVLNIMNGGSAYPALVPDLTCSSCTTTALAAATTRALPFAEAYDNNADATTATVGSDSNVRVFTCPVDGTYEVSASLIFGTLTAGDLAYLSAYITPIATGTAVEHRLGESFDYANGPSMGSGGTKRFRLLRGDKIHIGAITTRANATILANTNFTTFQVRLVSIP